MSFSDLTTEGTRIVWLYQFASGTTVWRYTSIKTDIVKSIDGTSYTWTSAAITHGNNAQQADPAQDKMTITVPITSAVGAAHLGNARGTTTTVTIFCCDFGDPDVAMEWKGKVLSSAPTSLVAMNFECESVGASATKEGLRWCAQSMCGAVVYGEGCNLNRALFVRECHATSVAGRVVTVTEGSDYTDLVGGIFSGPNEGSQQDRTIIAADGDELTLAWPIADLETWTTFHWPTGAHVNLYPACRRNLNDCKTKFGNVGKYRGFPWMDGINPMGGYTNVFKY